jgi:hypothetical protein
MQCTVQVGSNMAQHHRSHTSCVILAVLCALLQQHLAQAVHIISGAQGACPSYAELAGLWVMKLVRFRTHPAGTPSAYALPHSASQMVVAFHGAPMHSMLSLLGCSSSLRGHLTNLP